MSSNPLRAATTGALLLVSQLALSAPASAAEAALGLRWDDPNSLAPTTASAFDEQLATRLGRRAFVPGTEEPTLTVSWRGTWDRCRVELSLSRAAGVDGTRVIESPSGDCQALLPALLTVSALLVEAHQAASTPAPAPAEPSAPASPAARRELPEPRPAPTSAPRVLLSAGGAVSSGFVPMLELGPIAALTWAPRSYLRLGITGTWFVGHDYGEGPGVSLDHQRAAMVACGMPISSSLALGLCANVGLHHVGASGTSLPRPESHGLTTWSIGADLRAEWRLAPGLWWVGHAGADIATRPLYFYYLTAGAEQKILFTQRRVSPIVLLALSLEIP